jgi:hypothetical protein
MPELVLWCTLHAQSLSMPIYVSIHYRMEAWSNTVTDWTATGYMSQIAAVAPVLCMMPSPA